MRSAEDILKDIVANCQENGEPVDGGSVRDYVREARRGLGAEAPWYEFRENETLTRYELLSGSYDPADVRALIYADEYPKLVELTEDEILALIPPSSVDVLRADVAGDAAPVHALLLLFARKVIKAHHGEA